MNYYALNDDIFVVDGKARSAIYDLKNGELYSISFELKNLILETFNGFDKSKHSIDENELITNLISERLLVPSEKPGTFINLKENLQREYTAKFCFIEVTRECNMTCTFCYEESTPHSHERLSVDHFKIALNNLIESNIREIQFIGGEPLILRADLKEMILLARPHMDFIEVYTNGILINEDWCQFFKDNNINVAISMHSYIPEEHDKIVNLSGSYKKLLKAYNQLKQNDISIRVNGIVSKEIIAGKKKSDFPISINFDNPRLVGRANIRQYDFEMFKKKAITKETKRYPLSKSEVTLHVNAHQCFSKDIYIATDLNVYPCVMERRVVYGNLKKDKLIEVIQHPFRQLTKDQIEECKDCEYRYGCFDCRPDANSRGVYQKPWFCTYNPTEGKWIDLEEAFKSLNTHRSIANIPIVVE